jgi:hypothetical protein
MKRKHVYDKLNWSFNLIKSYLNDSKSKEYFIYKVIREKIYLLLILFMPVNNVKSQLLISQYIETSTGTTPKGIEIYNYSSSPIVFSNSNNLQISQGTNGGACTLLPGLNIISGTLAAGKVWVIGTSDIITYSNANPIDLTGATSYNFSFNGNDALILLLGGVEKDVFGTCGSDPGSNWSGSGVSTENQNIQLLATISAGTSTFWTNPSLRFETVSTTNEMTGFGTAPSFSTLPVELTSLSSICNENNTVSLEWTTASEHNSDFYTLEKSRDGITWNELKKIEAAGYSNSLLNYSFVDASNISGTVYYRLKQVDFDGGSHVYDIVSTNCSSEKVITMLAYPNPSNGQFTLKIENAQGGKYNISFKDLHGKEIDQKFIQLENGTTILKLNPANLQPGVYLLQLIQDGNVLQQQKLVVN